MEFRWTCLKRTIVIGSIVIGFLTFHAAPCWAQAGSATLAGTVADESGGVVPGAQVTVESVTTGFQRQVMTGTEGQFVFAALPPGRYRVNVQLAGFVPLEVTEVTLNVEDTILIALKMKVGGIGEQVSVVSEPSRVSTSAAVGNVIDRQFVENLPLNGRSFYSLVSLTPGVAIVKSTNGNPGQFSVNGQRATANYFTIDGASANFGVSAEPYFVNGSIPVTSEGGSGSTLVSLEGLQEVRIQTSTYSPEFGRSPGAQVSLLTRSGTSAFKGAVYEFFRDDALDANDWFANARGLPQAELELNNFGGVLGGPIPIGDADRRQTFFFASYERARLRLPKTMIAVVPSPTLRARLQTGVRAVIDAYPEPNGRTLDADYAEFSTTYSEPTHTDAVSLRVDRILNFGSKIGQMQIFGRYAYAPSKNVTRQSASPAYSDVRQARTDSATLGTTWNPRHSLVNELRLNWSRARLQTEAILDGFSSGVAPSTSLLFGPTLSTDGTESLTILPRELGSLKAGDLTSNAQEQLNVVNTLTWPRGKHQIKVGIDFRRVNATRLISTRRATVFSTVEDLVAGRATEFYIETKSPAHPQFTNWSVFGQDTWMASRRLTLTYGVRWDVDAAPTVSEGLEPLPVILGESGNPATFSFGTNGTPLYETNLANIAPRVGFSYLLRERYGLETIVRGGGGLFYDLSNSQWALGFSSSPPFIAATPRSRNMPFPIAPELEVLPPSGVITYPATGFAVDPQLPSPSTWQWSLGIEQSLGPSQSVSATYVGADGRNLAGHFRHVSPNPQFTAVFQSLNEFTSSYASLQLQFQRRLSRGIQALVAYTWSSAEDDVSFDHLANTVRQRGPSDFDATHVGTAAVTFELPGPKNGVGAQLLGGWWIDAIARLQSATPFTVRERANITVDGLRSDLLVRVVPDVPLWVDDPSSPGGKRLNTTLDPSRPGCKGPFCPASYTQYPSLGRNALRGHPFAQVDLSVRKRFRLGARVGLETRVEAFNVFNFANFGDPVSALTDPLFGESTAMVNRAVGSVVNPLFQVGGPRSIQLAAKVTF